MKKALAMIVLFCMIFTYTAYADKYNEYKEIKLGLFYASTAQDTVTLHSDGGFNICFGEDGNFEYRFSILEEDMTITKCDESDFYVNGNYFVTSGQFAIKPAYGVIGVNGNDYRGFILLNRLSSSDITVINIVGLEEYLASVIGQEMSPSWNVEALKAQAVCARSYAWTHLNNFASYGFDLCTTQQSQVYPGLRSETQSTRAAAAQTAGQTIRYNGVPVEGFYFSSDGGATENVENVWGSYFPYLRAVEDPYENPNEATKYFWSETFSADQIKAKLNSKGIYIGDITDIAITQTAATGRAVELTIYGTEDSCVSKRERARTILGLSSQQFTIAKQYGENGVPTSYTFSGNGWGHAVGMSQWGAKAMADRGFNYTDIIKHYFTGVEVY